MKDKIIIAFITVLKLWMFFTPYSYAQLQPGSKDYEVWKESMINQSKPFTISNSSSFSLVESSSIVSACELPYASNIDCTIEDPAGDPSFSELAPNDDGSTGLISLGFNFNLYGDTYNGVYINNNGNITFNNSFGSFTPDGFPITTAMIAPFWADVDTRGIGNLYYKVESTRLTVIWYETGYYSQQTDKTNTFKLIITDGNDPSIGIGNNVAFIYDDMQWTTGSASGGSNGFGGSPATVGVNKGTGQNDCFFMQFGRFDRPGTEYLGCQAVNGVDFLDGKQQFPVWQI